MEWVVGAVWRDLWHEGCFIFHCLGFRVTWCFLFDLHAQRSAKFWLHLHRKKVVPWWDIKMSDLVSDYKSCFANKKTLEFPQQKKGAAGPYCSQNHCAQRAMWVSLWFFCGGIWREHLKYGKMETIIRLEMNSICGWTWDNLILNSHFCDWNTVILCHISSTIQSLV